MPLSLVSRVQWLRSLKQKNYLECKRPLKAFKHSEKDLKENLYHKPNGMFLSIAGTFSVALQENLLIIQISP